MSLKSMMLSEEEKKEMGTESLIVDRPKFPHGLKIIIDKDTFKKLGLDGTPKAGDEFMMKAMVEVSEVSVESNQDDRKEPSMTLQITSMDLGSGEEKRKETSDVLFGGV